MTMRGLHWMGNRCVPESGLATDGHILIDCAYARPAAAAFLTRPTQNEDGDDPPPTLTRDAAIAVLTGAAGEATVPGEFGLTFDWYGSCWTEFVHIDGDRAWVSPYKLLFLYGCVEFDGATQRADSVLSAIVLRRGAIPVAVIMPLRMHGEGNPARGTIVRLPAVPSSGPERTEV